MAMAAQLGARGRLEERILCGAAAEWRIAHEDLPRQYAARMTAPGFELSDMLGTWGLWRRERRTIVLSRRLVTECGWKSVREVLRHEMAHQIVDEVLGGTDRPHGDRFAEACRLVGADPKASGTFPSIYEVLAQGEAEDDDRVMVRVKKLLALATSANRHEAEASMGKAHELITRYNVDLLSAERAKGYCSICLGEPLQRQSAERYAIGRLLGEFYFVQTIWVTMCVVDACTEGRVLEISGTLENVQMAEYVYKFLEQTIEAQWNMYRSGARGTAHDKVDFALGLIAGFRERLEAQVEAIRMAEGEVFAVVRVQDPKLVEYFRARHPQIRRLSGHGRMLDERVHAAGQEAGRRAILRRPIEGRMQRRGLLLAR